MKTTAGDYPVARLEELGLDHMIGIPGDVPRDQERRGTTRAGAPEAVPAGGVPRGLSAPARSG